jgi:UBX domain-containing protein 1
MATNSADQDEIVSHFCAMTDTRPPEVSFMKLLRSVHLPLWFHQAHQFLDANDWDLEAAVTDFFAEQDEALQDAYTGGDRRLGSDDSIEQPSGASTLESGPAAPSSATLGQPPHNRKPQKPQKKFATLGDLSAGNAAGDSSDEHDEPQDFFAGGEKSGLAVQNPDAIKQKIIEKAKR